MVISALIVLKYLYSYGQKQFLEINFWKMHKISEIFEN